MGIEAGCDQIGRLVREIGLQGATRAGRVRTTRPALVAQPPADLLERVFAAPAPNRLLIADLAYVCLWVAEGWVSLV